MLKRLGLGIYPTSDTQESEVELITDVIFLLGFGVLGSVRLPNTDKILQSGRGQWRARGFEETRLVRHNIRLVLIL